MHINATAHPTDAWVAQRSREATPFEETARHLICDNDMKCGPMLDAAAKTCGLKVIHIGRSALSKPPRRPPMLAVHPGH
jgi:hypothetical protein